MNLLERTEEPIKCSMVCLRERQENTAAEEAEESFWALESCIGNWLLFVGYKVKRKGPSLPSTLWAVSRYPLSRNEIKKFDVHETSIYLEKELVPNMRFRLGFLNS